MYACMLLSGVVPALQTSGVVPALQTSGVVPTLQTSGMAAPPAAALKRRKYMDEDKMVHECVEFEGILFTLTCHGQVATAEPVPGAGEPSLIRVTDVEESDSVYEYDVDGDLVEHFFFDHYVQDGGIMGFMVSVSERQIKEIMRAF